MKTISDGISCSFMKVASDRASIEDPIFEKLIRYSVLVSSLRLRDLKFEVHQQNGPTVYPIVVVPSQPKVLSEYRPQLSKNARDRYSSDLFSNSIPNVHYSGRSVKTMRRRCNTTKKEASVHSFGVFLMNYNNGMLWLHIIQLIGFVGAQLSNSLLLYLILTRGRKLFRTYRHVMMSFAVYCTFFAWIEVLTQPIIHIKSPACILFMQSPLKYTSRIGYYITCLYCGTLALAISLLAAQFLYRYFAVCKVNLLVRHEKSVLFTIYVPCVICSVAWYLFVYCGMTNTVEKQEYLKDDLWKYYDEDSTKTAFIAVMYWTTGENGERIWRFWDLMLLLACVLTIGGCFAIIIFCAIIIFLKIRQVGNLMSKKSIELNRQLFVTLTFQTLIPIFMMYIPVSLEITLPLLELETGILANFTAGSLAVYPFLESLIPMFCLTEFRKAFTCRRKNQISVVIKSPSGSGSTNARGVF